MEGWGKRKEEGKWAQRSKPLASEAQRGAIDEFNGRKTHPECRHMMAHDQSRRREGTRLSGVCGGEVGRAGWSGGMGEVGTTDSSSPGRRPCFPKGFISVADNRTLSASCKEEVKRKKLNDKKRRRFVSRGAISPSLNKSDPLSKTHFLRKTIWGHCCQSFKLLRPGKLE